MPVRPPLSGLSEKTGEEARGTRPRMRTNNGHKANQPQKTDQTNQTINATAVATIEKPVQISANATAAPLNSNVTMIAPIISNATAIPV